MYQWSAKRTNKSSCCHPVQTSCHSSDLGATILSNFCCLQLAEPRVEDGCLESKSVCHSHPQWHSSVKQDFTLASKELHQGGSAQNKMSRENSYAGNTSSLLSVYPELSHAESKSFHATGHTLSRTKIAEDGREVIPKWARLEYANTGKGDLSIPNCAKTLPTSCKNYGIILTSVGEAAYLEAEDKDAEFVIKDDRSTNMLLPSSRRKMVLASALPRRVTALPKPTVYLSCPVTEHVLQLPVPLPIYYAFFNSCQKFMMLTQKKQGGQAIFSFCHPAWDQRCNSSGGNQKELYRPGVFLDIEESRMELAGGSCSTKPGLSFHWVNNDAGTCAVLGMHIDSILAVIQDFRYCPSIILYDENILLPYQQSPARNSCSDLLCHNNLTRKDTSDAVQHNENCDCDLVSRPCLKCMPSAFFKQQPCISTYDSSRCLYSRMNEEIATECCLTNDLPAEFINDARGSDNGSVNFCNDYMPIVCKAGNRATETGQHIKFNVPSEADAVFHFTNSRSLLEIPVELAQANKLEDAINFVEDTQSSCITTDAQSLSGCSGEHNVYPNIGNLIYGGLCLETTELAPAKYYPLDFPEKVIIQKLKRLSHLLFDVYNEIRKTFPVSKKALSLPCHVLNEHKRLHSSTSSLEACPLVQGSKKKDRKKCWKKN